MWTPQLVKPAIQLVPLVQTARPAFHVRLKCHFYSAIFATRLVLLTHFKTHRHLARHATQAA